MFDISQIVDREIDTDLLIIGSEGAGCTAALEAVKKNIKVTMVTKGSQIGRSGATVTGDADLDVDSRTLHNRFGLPNTDISDSQDLFFKDIIKGGKYLNNQKLVEIHVAEVPERLQDLIDIGVKVNRVLHCSGHSYPRGVIIPGTQLMPVFRNAMKKLPVQLFPFTMIIDLLVDKGRISGAVGINGATGEFLIFRAKSIIIATGGAMRMYPFTTAPNELTGDGIAMAYRAGAELIDMEFPMFLPGAFPWPPALKGVDFPFILSTAGSIHGWLLNRHGERFMSKWDPVNFERTTRDIASVAMMSEILAGRGSVHGGVFVSLKHLPNNLIEYISDWKPKETFMQYGGYDMKKFLPDLKSEAVESVPASHFFNGGVRIDKYCHTNIEGLFAAGEVTGGVHGANRLSGNAFSEMIVWGHRSGKYASEYAEGAELQSINKDQLHVIKEQIFKFFMKENGHNVFEIRKKVQNIAWEKAGVVREGPKIEEALDQFLKIRNEELPEISLKSKEKLYNREWIQALELNSMLLILEAICRTSLARTESRGALYRKDFPLTNNVDWLVNQVVRKSEQGMDIITTPIVVTKLEPSRKIMRYGQTEE